MVTTNFDINDSEILSDPDNFTTNNNGQRLMTASGIKARVEELKKRIGSLEIIYFPDRPKDRLSDGIYLTNTSGKAKLCPECQEYHLSYNPLDNGGEFTCISCEKTWKLGEGKAAANQNGKARNTMAGRKSAAKNILDPSFVDPDTRDQPYSDSSKTTKYELAMTQLIQLLEKLGLDIADSKSTQFIKDARHYSQEFKRKKEQRENLISQLRLLDTQITATETLTSTLGESDPSYPVIKQLLDGKIEERDKLRKELSDLPQ